jgi:hypothetical protein
MYDKSGTENLRANQAIHGPKAHDTPSMSGADVGGRENLKAQASIKQGPRAKSTPSGRNNIPVKAYKDGVV